MVEGEGEEEEGEEGGRTLQRLVVIPRGETAGEEEARLIILLLLHCSGVRCVEEEK